MSPNQKSFLALYFSLNPEQQEQLHQLALQMKPRSSSKKPGRSRESAFQVHFGNPQGLFLVEDEIAPALEAFESFRQPKAGV